MTFNDPYTNEIIKDVKDSDFDHIVPLAYVNIHGGYKWDENAKKEFADNPNNGVCVNASDNRAKGAKGPGKWLPAYHKEDYCYTWLSILNKYHLTISESDMDKIKDILDSLNENDINKISLINDY